MHSEHEFGEQIRRLRMVADVSLREVARRANLSPAFLSDIELGRRMPSDEALVKIADAIGGRNAKLREALRNGRITIRVEQLEARIRTLEAMRTPKKGKK